MAADGRWQASKVEQNYIGIAVLSKGHYKTIRMVALPAERNCQGGNLLRQQVLIFSLPPSPCWEGKILLSCPSSQGTKHYASNGNAGQEQVIVSYFFSIEGEPENTFGTATDLQLVFGPLIRCLAGVL